MGMWLEGEPGPACGFHFGCDWLLQLGFLPHTGLGAARVTLPCLGPTQTTNRKISCVPPREPVGSDWALATSQGCLQDQKEA